MNRLLFVLLFLYSVGAKANYQYYKFDVQKVKVSDSSYRRYIIPQLKSLLKEYYHILEKVDPLQKEVLKIKAQTIAMRSRWEVTKELCLEISEECTKGLREIYHLSRSLDKNLSTYLNEDMSFPTESEKVDSTLKLHGSLDKLFNLNYKNLHAMEEYLITFGTPLFPYNKIHKNLGQNLHAMNLTCELAMTGKLIPEIQEEFDFVWNHFFKTIEEHLLSHKGQIYFLKRLGELNMAWNSFSMKMTKGNLKVPPEVSNIVKLMHNRWNSILKIVLRHN